MAFRRRGELAQLLYRVGVRAEGEASIRTQPGFDFTSPRGGCEGSQFLETIARGVSAGRSCSFPALARRSTPWPIRETQSWNSTMKEALGLQDRPPRSIRPTEHPGRWIEAITAPPGPKRVCVLRRSRTIGSAALNLGAARYVRQASAGG